MEAKHQLFSRSRALRDRQVYLDDDLTAAQQATRRSLAGEYQKLKMAKLRPFYRQDRLLYVHRGSVVQHQAGMALPTGSPAPQGPLQNRVPARQPAPAPCPVQQQVSRLPDPPSGGQRHPLQRCPLLRLLGRPLHRQLRSTSLHRRLQGK